MFAEPLASQSGLMLPSESDVSWGTHLADLPFCWLPGSLDLCFAFSHSRFPQGRFPVVLNSSQSTPSLNSLAFSWSFS